LSVYGVDTNLAKAHGHALMAGGAGFVLVILSTLSLRMGRFETSFIYIPLVAVIMWPRQASRVMTSVMLFLMGMLLDILSAGPVGLWAMIYMISYAIIRPDLRSVNKGLMHEWGRFCLTLGLVNIIIACLTFFITGPTAWLPLILQSSTALIVFPLIYAIWKFLRDTFFSSDPGFIS